MKSFYKLSLLLLIIHTLGFAQKHEVLNKIIPADENTTLIFNLENVSTKIEESTDGKVHFNFKMEFDGYSKKGIQKRLDALTVETSGFDGNITLKAQSRDKITFQTYEFNSPNGIYVEDHISWKTDSILKRKSKDSLLQEIRAKNKMQLKNPLKYINERFKIIDKNGKHKNVTKGSFKLLRATFIIKVPPFVKLNINAKDSGVFIEYDFQNELSANMKGGSFYAKELRNAYNVLKLDNCKIDAERLSGGNFDFVNVSRGKLGEIDGIKITSEFSKIEIGEIGRSSTITDFNSQYFIYSWGKSFENLTIDSRYSKWYFFLPNKGYNMHLMGQDNKVFEIAEVTKQLEIYNYDPNWLYSDSSLYGYIDCNFSNSIIYNYKL